LLLGGSSDDRIAGVGQGGGLVVNIIYIEQVNCFRRRLALEMSGNMGCCVVTPVVGPDCDTVHVCQCDGFSTACVSSIVLHVIRISRLKLSEMIVSRAFRSSRASPPPKPQPMYSSFVLVQL
jgi:hypothetical protein